MGLKGYFEEGIPKIEAVYISPLIPFAFKIKGLTEKELTEIKAFSEKELILSIILKGCIYPEFKGFQEIENVLAAGEAYRLAEEIIKAGGLDKSFSELKKEVSLMLLRGEAEAVYSLLAVFEMGIMPDRFISLERREKACLCAFLDEKIKLGKKRRR